VNRHLPVAVALALLVSGGIVGAQREQRLSLVAAEESSTKLASATAASGDPLDAFVSQYCASCHSRRVKRGGLVLQGVSASDPGADATLWENILRRVAGGEMPPHLAEKRPDAQELLSFTSLLMRRLDHYAALHPFFGSAPVRRLSKTEYGNALRDLFGVDSPFAAEMPADGISGGFDNIGDALAFSPSLLGSYLRVSRRAVSDAAGTGDQAAVTTEYLPRGSQAGWIGAGAPFDTRGGIAARQHVVKAGTYEIRAYIDENGLSPREGESLFRHRVYLSSASHGIVATFPGEVALREGPVPDVDGPGGRAPGGALDAQGGAIKQRLVFYVDGKPVRSFDVPGASPSAAAFGLKNGPPTLLRLEVEGPVDQPVDRNAAAAPVNSPVFICRPTAASDEGPCANRILTTFAMRAFRRDVTQKEMEPFLVTYRKSRAGESFDAAIAQALRQVLTSPQFLLRLEPDPPGSQPGKPRLLSGYEQASRISFFLWSSIPDNQLLEDARQGKLKTRAGRDKAVLRMLGDKRADALVDNFAMQWLGLRALRTAKPDLKVYPQFNESVRHDFYDETRLFLRYIFRNNQPVTQIVSANYSYLNERLAAIYSVPNVRGAAFRRVSFDSSSPRGGILGQGSILLMTSHADKTAPVLRGKWVLDNLLNSAPPPPPANVPALSAAPGEHGRKLTLRQQVERHRSSPQCASCHVRMDPIGFSLENFDVMGRWRDQSDALPIDANAQMPDGRAFSGPQGLRGILMASQDDFVAATVSRMLSYALGRRLDARDQPTVRQIVRDAKAKGYRVQDIILLIVNSDPFTKKLGNIR